MLIRGALFGLDVSFGRLKPSAPYEIPPGHRRVEQVSISDFGSQSEMGPRSRRHLTFRKCPQLGNPPIFEAIVFGI